MATRHALGVLPAATFVLSSLVAGCGGQSDKNGGSGGGTGQGGASQGGASQEGGGGQGTAGGQSLGGGPSKGGATSTGGATTLGGSTATGGSAQGGESEGCIYEGKAHRFGEKFKVSCNTCTCFGYAPNSFSCTTIECGDTCESTGDAFASAIETAKRCDPELASEQCTLSETSDLVCGCSTFVNPANAQELMVASAWRDTFAQKQCEPGVTCGACAEPRRGFCAPSGVCTDTYDLGGASCLVNGIVYPHGATLIMTASSCNFCNCENGALVFCTEINCDAACPPGTTRGQRCAQCGLAGGCDIVETGCLPVCAGTCPNAGQSCVNGICSILCE